MRDAFSDCHPLVNFLYFALVLTLTMCAAHPACQLLSLAAAGALCVRRGGWRALGKKLRYLAPMALLAALINPAFNHAGATILAYLPSGNPLTAESILYGLFAGVLLAAVVLWFSEVTAVITSDKVVYLFGRIAPALSLLLSMTLRFVPRFTAQLRTVARAQRGLGLDLSRGRLRARIGAGAAILSTMLTWALESAAQTADSMKARGYGLPGRSSFSLWRVSPRDRALLVWLFFCGFFLLCGCAAGAFSFRFYPTVRFAPVTKLGGGCDATFAALCLTPLILNEREARAWRRLRSDI